MKAFWTAIAIVLALLLQSGLTHLIPSQARVFDPFLLVLVYCGLARGETHGMLAGAAAGWVQDVHFGGDIVGIGGLTKVLVGFAVGLAGSRFLLVGPGPRMLVLFGATIVDALLFEQLSSTFDVQAFDLSMKMVVSRALVNAFVGLFAFELFERRFRGEVRP